MIQLNIGKATKVLDKIIATNATTVTTLAPIASIPYAQKQMLVQQQREARKKADLRGEWDFATGFDPITQEFGKILADVSNVRVMPRSNRSQCRIVPKQIQQKVNSLPHKFPHPKMEKVIQLQKLYQNCWKLN